MATTSEDQVRADRPRLVGTLKEMLDDHDLTRVQASYRLDGDGWRIVTVREASLLEDSPDGLIVEIEETWL